MRNEFTLEAHLKEYGNDPDFIYEEVVFDLNEQICQRMKERGVSRTQLAERIGVNKAYVTRILNGPANLTLKTIIKILLALDSRPRLIMERLKKDTPRARKASKKLRHPDRNRDLFLDTAWIDRVCRTERNKREAVDRNATA